MHTHVWQTHTEQLATAFFKNSIFSIYGYAVTLAFDLLTLIR